MLLYCNISDVAFFDPTTGETFIPGQYLPVQDEVKPQDLLRKVASEKEALAIKPVSTDYLLKDPRLVVVRELVYREPKIPSEFITDKDGKLVPNPVYDAKVAHYHGTLEEVVVNDEKAVEVAKEAYLMAVAIAESAKDAG